MACAPATLSPPSRAYLGLQVGVIREIFPGVRSLDLSQAACIATKDLWALAALDGLESLILHGPCRIQARTLMPLACLSGLTCLHLGDASACEHNEYHFLGRLSALRALSLHGLYLAGGEVVPFLHTCRQLQARATMAAANACLCLCCVAGQETSFQSSIKHQPQC